MYLKLLSTHRHEMGKKNKFLAVLIMPFFVSTHNTNTLHFVRSVSIKTSGAYSYIKCTYSWLQVKPPNMVARYKRKIL